MQTIKKFVLPAASSGIIKVTKCYSHYNVLQHITKNTQSCTSLDGNKHTISRIRARFFYLSHASHSFYSVTMNNHKSLTCKSTKRVSQLTIKNKSFIKDALEC
ncbi:hypothetical protein Hanom_Chr13g01220181 [Helianthus anomalus]